MSENPTILFRIQDDNGDAPIPLHLSFPCYWDKADVNPDNYLGEACKSPDDLRRQIPESQYKCLLEARYKAVKLVAHKILIEKGNQVLFERKTPLNQKTISFDLY